MEINHRSTKLADKLTTPKTTVSARRDATKTLPLMLTPSVKDSVDFHDFLSETSPKPSLNE